VSDCCLKPNEQFFIYIMRRLWYPLCTRPTRLVGFFVRARSLKQQ